jgi:post-segregation antitoxin (ccd killing protein)
VGSRLVNVRLDEERVEKARLLRQRGVALSALVREAIDDRFETMAGRRTPADIEAVVAGIFDEHPDPPGLRPRGYDVHDRLAARRAIRRALRRKRR